jgi:hypothetical protein
MENQFYTHGRQFSLEHSNGKVELFIWNDFINHKTKHISTHSTTERAEEAAWEYMMSFRHSRLQRKPAINK